MPTHPSSDADNSPSSPLQSSGPSAPPSQELWRPADPARFREMVARMVSVSRPPTPSPAMNFGAYVRRAVDPEPGRGPSATDLARILRLDPISKEHDRLKDEVAGLRKGMEEQAAEIKQLLGETSVAGSRPRSTRRKKKVGGRGVKKDNTYWLDRWEKDVGLELQAEGCPRNEFIEQMIERVYSLASDPAADAINERYRQYNRGQNVTSASSLRRRAPATITTDARGESVRVKGAFICERWGQWEKYRHGAEPETKLADGSSKMECDGEDKAEEKPRVWQMAAGAQGDQRGVNRDEDNRKRNAFDNSLQIATSTETALEAVDEGDLVIREGGEGVTRLAPPIDAQDREQDNLDRQAGDLLESAGLSRQGAPRRRKARLKA